VSVGGVNAIVSFTTEIEIGLVFPTIELALLAYTLNIPEPVDNGVPVKYARWSLNTKFNERSLSKSGDHIAAIEESVVANFVNAEKLFDEALEVTAAPL
jgi:hypothetical protein